MKNLKQTIINGLLFLIPLTILLIIFLKLYDILIKIATPLGSFIPLEKVGGITIANLLVLVLILLLCLITGWFTNRQWMKNLQSTIENKILVKIPGYTIVQGFTNDLKATEKASEHFKPVLVRFDDQEQMCFEIERMSNDKVVIFVPGAPSPWSGGVVYVDAERVTQLTISVSEAAKNIQRLGLNSEDLISKKA